MRQQIADLEIQHEKEVSALSEEVSHLKKKVALYESTQKRDEDDRVKFFPNDPRRKVQKKAYKSSLSHQDLSEPRYLYLLGPLGELASAVPVRGIVG